MHVPASIHVTKLKVQLPLLLGVTPRPAFEDLVKMLTGPTNRAAVELTADPEQADLTIDVDLNGMVMYRLTDSLISQHRLRELCFQTEFKATSMHAVIRGAYHFFNRLRQKPASRTLDGNIKYEFHEVEQTADIDDSLQYIYRRRGIDRVHVGIVSLEADEEKLYGMTITNGWNRSLYVALFYFDCSDLSISTLFIITSVTAH